MSTANIPMRRIGPEHSAGSTCGNALLQITNNPSNGCPYEMVMDREEAKQLLGVVGEFIRTSAGQQTALLMGGPKHGELVAVEQGAHEVTIATLDQPLHIFSEDEARPISIGTGRYKRVNDYAYPLPFYIFEYETLADENVALKANRLDRELTNAKKEFTEADTSYQRSEREQTKRERAHEELYTKRQKAKEAFEFLDGQRTKLAKQFGV